MLTEEFYNGSTYGETTRNPCLVCYSSSNDPQSYPKWSAEMRQDRSQKTQRLFSRNFLSTLPKSICEYLHEIFHRTLHPLGEPTLDQQGTGSTNPRRLSFRGNKVSCSKQTPLNQYEQENIYVSPHQVRIRAPSPKQICYLRRIYRLIGIPVCAHRGPGPGLLPFSQPAFRRP